MPVADVPPPPPPAIYAPAPPQIPNAVRAALVQQSGQIKAAQETAAATKAAAEKAANNAMWAAILALVGAVVASIVAWRNGVLQTRTSQQLKHADFRQAWIDKLREEMARFARVAVENDGTPEKAGAVRESLSIILLRMNKDDPDYAELLTLMGQVADQSRLADTDEVLGSIANFIAVSQRILKREWDVTKQEMYSKPKARMPRLS